MFAKDTSVLYKTQVLLLQMSKLRKQVVNALTLLSADLRHGLLVGVAVDDNVAHANISNHFGVCNVAYVSAGRGLDDILKDSPAGFSELIQEVRLLCRKNLFATGKHTITISVPTREYVLIAILVDAVQAPRSILRTSTITTEP